MRTYDAAVERQMVNFFKSLSEKDRRRYAAVEAAKLGHAGTAYVRSDFLSVIRTRLPWGCASPGGQGGMTYVRCFKARPTESEQVSP